MVTRAYVVLRLFIVLLPILSLGLTACGAGQSSPSPQPSSAAQSSASKQSAIPSPAASEKGTPGDPIKIGAIIPFTGRYAPVGEPMKKTFEMIEQYLNKQGGIAGRPAKLILYDDEGDQAKSAQLADRLIQLDKVVAIIGPIPTANAQAVTEIAERAKTVEIYLNPTKSLTANKKYIFQGTANDELEMERQLLTIKKLGKQNTGILYDASPYGTTATQVFTAMAPQTGLKIAGQEKYGGEDRDVTPQLTKLKNAGGDVLVVLGTNPASPLAAKQAKQLGINLPILVTSVAANPAYIEQAGEAAEGVYGIGFFNPDAASSNAELRRLMDAYKAKYNEDISSYSGGTWDAVMLLKAGIEKSGGKVDGDSIAAALESLKDYQGALGKRNLSNTDHTGFTVDSVWPQQVKNGRWVVIPTN